MNWYDVLAGFALGLMFAYITHGMLPCSQRGKQP